MNVNPSWLFSCKSYQFRSKLTSLLLATLLKFPQLDQPGMTSSEVQKCDNPKRQLVVSSQLRAMMIQTHKGLTMHILKSTSFEFIWVFPKIMVPPNHPLKNRVFHYKPSILGYPYFWKHPYTLSFKQTLQS